MVERRIYPEPSDGTSAARRGHAEQYVLASLYQHGEGVEANEAEAAEWFEQRREQPLHLMLLADCYLRGEAYRRIMC